MDKTDISSQLIYKTISKLRYPFLTNMPDQDDLYNSYLIQIDSIARRAFGDEERPNALMSYQHLADLVSVTPRSWKIHVKNEQVMGFIHVQAITSSAGQKLLNGQIDENDFKLGDICPDDQIATDACIHIGSINSVYFPTFSKDLTPMRLIAGIIDRIQELKKHQKSLHIVVCTDFSDIHGVSHFGKLLPKYGFTQTSTTPSGDPVYMVDIEKCSIKFQHLMEAVAIKIAQSYKKGENGIKRKKSTKLICKIALKYVFYDLPKILCECFASIFK